DPTQLRRARRWDRELQRRHPGTGRRRPGRRQGRRPRGPDLRPNASRCGAREGPDAAAILRRIDQRDFEWKEGTMRRFRDLFAIGRRAAANSSARPRRPRRGPLGLEPLEDRVVLSTFLVTNGAASGAGSPLQAIVDSDGTPGPNEIDFAAGLTGTITLTSGQLTIANNAVTIVGPGADVLSVSGNYASRVFEVDAVQAALSGLTITNGNLGTGTQ